MKSIDVDVHALLRRTDEQKAARAAQLPTLEDCLRMANQVHLRLKEMGWNEAVYSPKDGSYFDAIEFGCTRVMDCMYLGDWPKGRWFAAEAGDLWPVRPALFKLKPAALPSDTAPKGMP